MMNGEFGYYQLLSWWNDSFTYEEKANFKALWNEEAYNGLFNGEIISTSKTALFFLGNMGYRLCRIKKFDLAIKFLEKGEASLPLGTATDKHFLFYAFMEYYSKYSPYNSCEKLLEYARKQIEVGADAAVEMIEKSMNFKISHTGYEILHEYLLTNGRKEEAKLLKAKARKEKWNYSYL